MREREREMWRVLAQKRNGKGCWIERIYWTVLKSRHLN